MSKLLVVGVYISAVILYGLFAFGPFSLAESLQSNSYRFEESTVGGGGLIQSNSANFQSGVSLGDTAIGNSASENFQMESGSRTTNDPTLSFSVNSGAANFGDFSPSVPATTTSTFSVSNYTSYGYVVQITGDTPTNGSHVLPAMTTSGPSQAGVEQFGINLVANTEPTSVGANPQHGLFASGDPAPNYGTANSYRYVSGETIALASKSSGVTNYTISYLANVGSLTPGGQYKANQVIICTGTY